MLMYFICIYTYICIYVVCVYSVYTYVHIHYTYICVYIYTHTHTHTHTHIYTHTHTHIERERERERERDGFFFVLRCSFQSGAPHSGLMNPMHTYVGFASFPQSRFSFFSHVALKVSVPVFCTFCDCNQSV
jgi:hypothetical protein